MTLPLNLQALVYGDGGPDVHDPAELFHEASKLYPATAARATAGIRRLEADPELQRLALGSVRRAATREVVWLPSPARLDLPLGDALRLRRSAESLGGQPIDVDQLATLLHAAYGVVGGPPLRRRTAPSGGALYPLELYVFTLRVTDVPVAVFHVDPHRHALESLVAVDGDRLREALIQPELVERAAALVVVTAIFMRTRFKYGLRGYRFALLEAGHVVQNLLLAAAACDVAALPLAGFYDRCLEELVGANGVDESIVYLVALGRS